MGHLSRTLKFANILKKNGHKCFFYIDKKKDLKEIKINYPVFEIDRNYVFQDETIDAKKFIKLLKKEKGFIIVDDYRLKTVWQNIIKKNKHKLIHISDDAKLNDISDYKINYKINSYKIKKNKTKYLLGPKYVLLERGKISSNIHNYKKFNIILYLGGSGNLEIFEGMSKEIKKKFLQNNITNFDIKIILGPLVKNKEKFIKKYKKIDKITIINGEYNLIDIYKNSQLFLGSSGTSVYETCHANIPTILFKYVNNQDDSISDLEKIGHFFHLEKKEINNFNQIAKLVFLIFKNYSKIKKITNNKKLKIDTLGPKRIYNVILNKEKIITYNEKDIESRNSKFKFSIAKDTDMNKILDLRNEKNNTINSNNYQKISGLSHYIWWLESKTKIWVLKKGNLLKIVFWYKIINIHKKKYILTGWYSSKNLNFINVLNGIVKFNKLLKKNYKILSIVKKNNKVSLAIDKYLGYKKLETIDSNMQNYLIGNNINLKKVIVSIK